MNKEKIITVFGSSRPQENDQDYREARELGTVSQYAAVGMAV